MTLVGAFAIGELIGERYEVEEAIGSGGMSTVYKARDRLLGRRVALKVLHPHLGEDEEYVARFRAEAQAVAQLSHPNIVTVIDRGLADGRQFIVFEYVDGENLKQLLTRTGAQPVRRAVELVLGAADGLAFAHHQGFVHRDVKPQNVLVGPLGDAKVTDFGIARSLGVESGLTETGTVVGTSEYLSPEQASGLPVTPAADVYSLAVVLFELLDGSVPFSGDNVVAVAMQHVNKEPPSLLERRPDVPARLAAAVERGLAKDPADRFSSMAAFADELRAFLEGSRGADEALTAIALEPVPRPSAPRRERLRRRPRLPAILGGIGLVAAVAAVGWVLAASPAKRLRVSTADGAVSTTLHAIGNYDPSGPPDTHGATAAAATDGDPNTFWYTQIYGNRQFGNLKQGLGLELEEGSPVKLAHLTVTTATPGFQATVLAANSRDGSFTPDSSSQTVGSSTTFALRRATARYYVLWITVLPPGDKAEVSEITGST